MKNGKLLFLLVAVLSLAMLFASCDSAPANETSEPAGETTAAESNATLEQEEVEHEIRDYFVVSNGIENVSYSTISKKFDGKIVQVDTEHNLMSLETTDLDNYNNVIKTVKVYDVITGECIFEDSVTYPLYATGEDKVDFSVRIDYPIIRSAKTGYSEDSDGNLEPEYDVSYYFAKKDSEAIKTTDKNEFSKTTFQNGLVAFEMGNEVVWVNRNMEVVRTVNAVAANGYDVDVFNSEYQDYLYAWNNYEVQVFNRAGVCSAIYTKSTVGTLSAFVLNNGNVLIQDVEFVDDYTACDFVFTYDYKVVRAKLTSYVMSCTDGALEEVELDFVVDYLETAYEGRLGENNFPFTLAGNGQNQAIIYRFANGSLSLWQEYVSINNDLTIQYTVKNSCMSADFTSASVINANLYQMRVYEGGTYQSLVFDLDGNVVTANINANRANVTDTYIVTSNAIYDHNMNVVYDIANGDFAGTSAYTLPMTNVIYFGKTNFETGAREVYVFDHATKAPKLICDGVTEQCLTFNEGYLVTYDVEENHDNLIVGNGNVILKALNITNIRTCSDALIVEAEFEGNTLVYVVK